LMIIEGTRMARWYRQKTVSPLTLDAYAALAGSMVSRLRPDQSIHRIVADTRPDRGLIAPAWSADKPAAISRIHGYFKEHGITQSSAYA
ncbi:MAG: hypothetical protein GF418_10765, partial [Chitinivibrionales bacterium]|nr:hypothetical protein [Chitinivibrionales bacterium]MBD3396096.1 hypothetical protein [Chitinivibrionales bacterium]